MYVEKFLVTRVLKEALGRVGEINCYRYTDPPTKRVLEELSLLKIQIVSAAAVFKQKQIGFITRKSKNIINLLIFLIEFSTQKTLNIINPLILLVTNY